MPLVQAALTPRVESVEVLKGPASLLYGIIDPGGIVNTISKRPERYQHGEVTLEARDLRLAQRQAIRRRYHRPDWQDGPTRLSLHRLWHQRGITGAFFG